MNDSTPTPPPPPPPPHRPAQSEGHPPGQPGQPSGQRQRRGGRRRGGRGRGRPQDQNHNRQSFQPQNDHDDFEDAPPQEPLPPPTFHPHVKLPEAFEKLGLEPAILYSLAEIHFEKPSEIQEKLIPIALTGRDIIGQARTGTGKTAAFGLPIIQNVDMAKGFQALVVVPTRELAVQVEAELTRLARHKRVRTAVVYGGQRISGQVKKLGHNPHIIVGTPGRIMDLNERGNLPLDDVRFVVCDEVDRMFDIGFRDDIRKILSLCSAPHQTMFVSATISDDIERMVARHMDNPERVFTSDPEEQLTNPEATQYYVGVQPWDKLRALKMLLKHEQPGLAIVFCRTKRSVDKVAHALTENGINASPIHGDLLQTKRERIMRGFRTGKINVLVATDLASRGIDVHEVTHVINYDIPDDPEVYVHRVGRTARMGATGKAIAFVSRGEAQLQTEIEKLINHLLEEYKISGFEPRPEPNPQRHAEATPGDPNNPPPANDQPGTNGPASTTPQNATGPQPDSEGYMPTSFENVKPTTVRPLSGKFPSRRRR